MLFRLKSVREEQRGNLFALSCTTHSCASGCPVHEFCVCAAIMDAPLSRASRSYNLRSSRQDLSGYIPKLLAYPGLSGWKDWSSLRRRRQRGPRRLDNQSGIVVVDCCTCLEVFRVPRKSVPGDAFCMDFVRIWNPWCGHVGSIFGDFCIFLDVFRGSEPFWERLVGL